MADSPTSHRELIDRWPNLPTFARDIGVEYGTAKAMRRRGSIPVDRWPTVIEAAKRREIEGVSYETLTLLHPRTGEPAGCSA